MTARFSKATRQVTCRLALAGVLWAGAVGAAQATVVVYDTLPQSPSEAPNSIAWNDVFTDGASNVTTTTLTTMLGDAITLSDASRALSAISVLLSSTAEAATYGATSSSGYSVPMTLSLYRLGSAGSDPAVGTLFAQSTTTATIPWLDPSSNASAGVSKNVSFNFPGVMAPGSFIVGLSFDASSGPASELGFVLSTVRRVGTDIDPDAIDWGYTETDNPGGTTTTAFSSSPGWSGYGAPAIRVELVSPPVTVPEPASWMLLAGVVPAVGALRRRAGHRV